MQWLCKEGITQAQYAKKVNVSRQAISDRLDNALKRMLEVE
ncbi:MAG: helix-turn-helix domain-containing protein [Clostridia bacterium]